jgi:hypothetical protein
MTASLSDHSLDQIFRSARTFNGWAGRPVEDGRNRRAPLNALHLDLLKRLEF